MIRSILAALLLLAIPSILCATLPGEALQGVLKEKGMPLSKMEFRNVKILLYPDAEIRLEDDVVVTVTPRTNTTLGKSTPKQQQRPKPQTKPRPKPQPKCR